MLHCNRMQVLVLDLFLNYVTILYSKDRVSFGSSAGRTAPRSLPRRNPTRTAPGGRARSSCISYVSRLHLSSLQKRDVGEGRPTRKITRTIRVRGACPRPIKFYEEEAMRIGLDFGTTTTVASVFDGQALRLIPLDPSDTTPEVFRSVLLIGREGELLIGRAAIDHYSGSNVGRAVAYDEVYVGTIEMTFDGVGTMIKDVHAIVDKNIPARLFQSLKTALRDPSYTSTDVFGTRWSVE